MLTQPSARLGFQRVGSINRPTGPKHEEAQFGGDLGEVKEDSVSRKQNCSLKA